MRILLLGPLAALVVLLAGCGSNESSYTAARPAPPQDALLDWVEPTSPRSPRLVFTVRGVTVTNDGWRARVGIRNESAVPWSFDAAGLPSSLFGVMLFATGGMDELEERNRSGDLPGIREARSIVPAPPPRLEPGESWEGTIAAPGALAAGRWLRVVFGPLESDGRPPDGLPSPLLWISDNAHLLRG
jgi:hypothetical protein